MANLPRGGLTPQSYFNWPSEFSAGLQTINLRQQLRAAQNPDHIHYLDCGPPLVPIQHVSYTLLKVHGIHLYCL